MSLLCVKKNSLKVKSVASVDRDVTTEVTIDDGSDHEVDRSSWSVARVFGIFFHASPNSKLALKLFGNKKSIIQEKKRQENGSLKWMIHPYSRFRYFSKNIDCSDYGIKLSVN